MYIWTNHKHYINGVEIYTVIYILVLGLTLEKRQI